MVKKLTSFPATDILVYYKKNIEAMIKYIEYDKYKKRIIRELSLLSMYNITEAYPIYILYSCI